MNLSILRPVGTDPTLMPQPFTIAVRDFDQSPCTFQRVFDRSYIEFMSRKLPQRTTRKFCQIRIYSALTLFLLDIMMKAQSTTKSATFQFLPVAVPRKVQPTAKNTPYWTVQKGEADFSVVVYYMSYRALLKMPNGYIGPVFRNRLIIVHARGFLKEELQQLDKEELLDQNLIIPLFALFCFRFLYNILSGAHSSSEVDRRRRRKAVGHHRFLLRRMFLMVSMLEMLLIRAWRSKIINFFNHEPLKGNIRSTAHLIDLLRSHQVKVVVSSSAYMRVFQDQMQRIGTDKEDDIRSEIYDALLANDPIKRSPDEAMRLLTAPESRYISLMPRTAFPPVAVNFCPHSFQTMVLQEFKGYYTGLFTSLPKSKMPQLRLVHKTLFEVERDRIIRSRQHYDCPVTPLNMTSRSYSDLAGIFIIQISLTAGVIAVFSMELFIGTLAARCHRYAFHYLPDILLRHVSLA